MRKEPIKLQKTGIFWNYSEYVKRELSLNNTRFLLFEDSGNWCHVIVEQIKTPWIFFSLRKIKDHQETRSSAPEVIC